MFRNLLLVLCLSISIGTCARAAESNTSIFGIEDVSGFAESLSAEIATDGMAPLRRTFEQFGTEATANRVNLDGAIIAFERAIGEQDATRWSRIEDLMLGDEVRTVYFLHVYPNNTCLFTRYDFVRVGPRTWNMIAATFASQWGQVAVPTTQGFRSVIQHDR